MLFGVLPTGCWGSVFVLVLCVLSSFANILKRKRELVALLLLLTVLRMSCYCKCSVTLPHGAVGWSAVYDCGIS